MNRITRIEDATEAQNPEAGSVATATLETGQEAQMKIYIAEYESRNFTFEAFSDSEDGARFGILRTLLAHGEQYHCEDGWFEGDDISIRTVIVGRGYRDGEEIS